MTYKERQRVMRELQALAQRRDQANDVVGRNQAANEWRQLATDAEARRAPKYLQWYGTGH